MQQEPPLSESFRIVAAAYIYPQDGKTLEAEFVICLLPVRQAVHSPRQEAFLRAGTV